MTDQPRDYVVAVDRLPHRVTRVRFRSGRESLVDETSQEATDWIGSLLVKPDTWPELERAWAVA
jgi:hypothetical protein